MRVTFRAKLLGLVGHRRRWRSLVIIVASSVVAHGVERSSCPSSSAISRKSSWSRSSGPAGAHLARLPGCRGRARHRALEATRDLKNATSSQAGGGEGRDGPRGRGGPACRPSRPTWTTATTFSQPHRRRDGRGVVDAMAAMQAKQARVSALGQEDGRPRPARHDGRVRRGAPRRGHGAELPIGASLACLASVLLLSLTLSRGLVRAQCPR